MIRHIVMFTLKATDVAERNADVSGIREVLNALVGVVPGLRSMSFEPDLGQLSGHWDAVLVSDHDSVEALDGYQSHPQHVAAAAFIGERIVDRATVDFEV